MLSYSNLTIGGTGAASFFWASRLIFFMDTMADPQFARPPFRRRAATAHVARPWDVVTSGDYQNVGILRGRGDGTFRPAPNYNAGRQPFSL
jgi:hypothetical protein